MLQPPGPLEVQTPSDTEIVVRRSFNAPRELLFACWTQAALIRRWMSGPPGWTFTVCESDARPGGAYRFGWKGPEGMELGIAGVYREVEPPARLVNTQLFDGDSSEVVGELVLTDLGGGRTGMVNTLVYPSKEVRDGALASGMADGMEMGYARLDGLLADELA